MADNSGRPTTSDTETDSVRERLLAAARKCFLEDEYHRVSTRRIAREADTTIAMIRYYFSSKEGLYQQMIRDQVRPVLDALNRLQKGDLPESLNDFFAAYYRTMVPNPEFPILMMKTLSLKQGPSRDFIISSVVRPGQKLFARTISELQTQGKIDADYDPELLRLSVFSLMVMPMIARPMLQEQAGTTPDLEFYLRLAAHNSQLLARACQPTGSDEPVITSNHRESRHD